MFMSIVSIPKSLRDRLGDEASEGLTHLFSDLTESAHHEALALAEKNFELRLTKEVSILRQDLAVLKAEIKTDMASSKAEIIKWMFLFWTAQVAVIIGFLSFALRLFPK